MPQMTPKFVVNPKVELCSFGTVSFRYRELATIRPPAARPKMNLPTRIEARLKKIVGMTPMMQMRLVSMIDFLRPIFLKTISIAKEPIIKPDTPALEMAVLFLVLFSPQLSLTARMPPT